MTPLVFTEEQEAFRALLRRFLAEKSDSVAVRACMQSASGYDPQVWRQMADELGLQGIHIPDAHDGSDFGWVELLIVFEEMGRALLCSPYLSTVALGATTLLLAGDEAAQATFLPTIARGELIATLALAEASGSWQPSDVMLAAVETSNEWTLTGEKCFVLDGIEAGLVLVAARTENGLSLFAVEGSSSGLTRLPHEVLDPTRKMARLIFDGVPATLVGAEGGAEPVLDEVLVLASIALAAEQVGGAQRCLDMSVDYAKTRFQYGRAIGSFQAVKHMCADALLSVETARSAAYRAAWDAAAGNADTAAHASLAKAFCSDTFVDTAAMTIQVHGGIGFTWEHDAHLYYRRARAGEYLMGTPAEHREKFLQLIEG